MKPLSLLLRKSDRKTEFAVQAVIVILVLLSGCALTPEQEKQVKPVIPDDYTLYISLNPDKCPEVVGSILDDMLSPDETEDFIEKTDRIYCGLTSESDLFAIEAIGSYPSVFMKLSMIFNRKFKRIKAEKSYWITGDSYEIGFSGSGSLLLSFGDMERMFVLDAGKVPEDGTSVISAPLAGYLERADIVIYGEDTDILKDFDLPVNGDILESWNLTLNRQDGLERYYGSIRLTLEDERYARVLATTIKLLMISGITGEGKGTGSIITGGEISREKSEIRIDGLDFSSDELILLTKNAIKVTGG